MARRYSDRRRRPVFLADRPETAGHQMNRTIGGVGEALRAVEVALRVTGCTRDIALFQEYARAFKGARQLTWSKGLKERYEVDQESNAELIERQDREAVPVLEVDPEAFRQIVDKDLLSDFLEAVEVGGRAGGFHLAIVLARAQVPRRKVGFVKGMDLRYWYGDE